jgi:N-acyl-D-aspartate/D-glutamate deacylase
MTHWVRDREAGRLTLEDAVQRQCRGTAETVGLLDRGLLAPGYKADINVIDFDRLAVARPRIVADLPAGGSRLLQDAAGYLHTVVSGTETYRNGEATGDLPGRFVRGAQEDVR